jgi:hypothetical protein
MYKRSPAATVALVERIFRQMSSFFVSIKIVIIFVSDGKGTDFFRNFAPFKEKIKTIYEDSEVGIHRLW